MQFRLVINLLMKMRKAIQIVEFYDDFTHMQDCYPAFQLMLFKRLNLYNDFNA